MDHDLLAGWIARLAARRLDLRDTRPGVTDALISRRAVSPTRRDRDGPAVSDLLIALGLLGVGVDPDLDGLCAAHGTASVIAAATALSDALVDLSSRP